MTKQNTAQLGDPNFTGDDAVLPFEIQELDARGRIIQLGATVNSILQRHQYPEPVSQLLAEAMVLTVLLGSSLKFDGKFILQTSSDGPVSLLVCDFQLPSSLRAYARFDSEKLKEYIANNQTEPEALLGKGTLALTVDQGNHMQRYQGIVALDGANLEEVAQKYFAQSEQIPTSVRLAVATLYSRDEQGKSQKTWRAGGILTQFIPESNLHEKRSEQDRQALYEANWSEVQALTQTAESAEMTDPLVGTERLLFRLFHQHEVRVFEPRKVIDACSCSRQKIEDVLNGLSSEEIAESIEDNEITVTCEFCSTVYRFNPQEFQADTKQHAHKGGTA